MDKFKFLGKDKTAKLPKNSGVYCFKKGRELFYIGKASNIRDRVKNHFQQPVYRNGLFINQIEKIGFVETNSEIEALLLEAKLIKKYQPKYNIFWRDDKNYFFVGITKEKLPRVFITHQPRLQTTSYKLQAEYIGPFVEGRSLKKTLRFLRRVFPYYTARRHQKNPCPYCHLNLCPGPNPDLKKYRKNIKNLIDVLKGKRQSVLKNLRREMQEASNQKLFEKAAEVRDRIRSLENIITNIRVIETPFSPREDWRKTRKILQKIVKLRRKISKIEAYDVSNIQGKEATGSMIVFFEGKPNKNLYRKFKIKFTKKPNDLAMMEEVVSRRLKHQEWPLPDLILIDGGKAQLNAARRCLTSGVKQIKIIALAKRKNELYIESRRSPLLLKSLPREIFNLILQLRDEAHRFAIAYHRRLRKIDLIPKS